MMLLPVVDRELRVTARRRMTYWLRFFLVLLVSCFWFFLLTMLPGGFPLQRGPMVFLVVASLAFGFCSLAGVFLSADSLSQEKREGTLGLLFLTSLRGHDVVLGKLLATSLHAVYGLLAVLPIFALAMLVGGITGGEFFRLTLALLATLFLSLSVGLLVSAVSSDTRYAMGSCLVVMLGFTAILPGLGWMQSVALKSNPWKLFVWPSPASAYWYAFEMRFRGLNGSTVFWGSLLTVVLLGAGTLALASWLLPSQWSEKSAEKPDSFASQFCRKFASRTNKVKVLTADMNPFLWLASRDLRPERLTWFIISSLVPVWLVLIGGSLTNNSATSLTSFCLAMLVAFGMHQALKWLMASEATRRLSEDRQSGALELLLVTPVSIYEIIADQREALKRLFLAPMLITIATNLGLFCLLVSSPPLALVLGHATVFCEVFVCGAILLVVDFYAMGWIGMRSAFQTQRHHRAIFATLAQVILVPWLVVAFLVLLIMGGAGLGHETLRVLTVLWFALAGVLVISNAARAKAELPGLIRNFSAPANTETATKNLESVDSPNPQGMHPLLTNLPQTTPHLP